jgi:uncharacterized integral membrane protein (TIGR00698 family)
MSAYAKSALTTSEARLRSGHQFQFKAHVPGLTLAAVLAFLAIALDRFSWLQSNGISALTLAIVLGMLIGNTVYPSMANVSAEGVAFSKQKLLRFGIILYGLRVTFQDIGRVGLAGVAIDAVIVCSTFALAWLIGTRVLGIDRKTSMLIGAGSSICGAAAVMAAEPVVRGRSEQVTIAVSTVVVFGTLAIFLYPVFYHLNRIYLLLPMTPKAYGIFAGSTIHEVAQVVAAGRAVGEEAASTAVITKMVRVMMLAPFLVVLSAYLSRSRKASPSNTHDQSRRIAIPWFAFGFIAVAGLNSLSLLNQSFVNIAVDVDTFVLTMAMTALGLTTHIPAIRQAGIRPLALAAILFIWLICGGIVINIGFMAMLA